MRFTEMIHNNWGKIIILISILFIFNQKVEKTMVFNNFDSFNMKPNNSTKSICKKIKVVCTYDNKNEVNKIIFKTLKDSVLMIDSVFNINKISYFTHRRSNDFICTYKFKGVLREIIFVKKNNMYYIENIKELTNSGIYKSKDFPDSILQKGFKSQKSLLNELYTLKIKEQDKKDYYSEIEIKYYNCHFQFQRFHYWNNLKSKAMTAPPKKAEPKIESWNNCFYLDVNLNNVRESS